MAPTINPRVHETGEVDWVVMRPVGMRVVVAGGEDGTMGDGDGSRSFMGGWNLKGNVLSFLFESFKKNYAIQIPDKKL